MIKMTKLLSALLMFGMAGSASATQLKVTGDLNNRFMLYTDQATLYSGSETIATSATASTPRGVIANKTIGETWVEIKYRLGAEIATDDGAVKGVYMLELGAIRFGDTTVGAAGGNRGGGYSGDGNNYETRFAYVDFAVGPKQRLAVGLQPFTANKYLWSETAMGVQYKGQAGPAGITAAWIRGGEVFNTTARQEQFRDADSLFLRGEAKPMKDTGVGLFGLYQRARPELVPSATVAANRAHLLKRFGGVEYDLFNVGIDGSLKSGPLFANVDFVYQFGESRLPVLAAARQDLDHAAFFGHLDLGANFGAAKVTYTGWYASGDDNATDKKAKNYIATDVDVFDSIVLFEGGYTDDNYFTEAPYFLDRGAVFNRLGVDFKASNKLTVSGAVMYIMSAKEFTIGTAAAPKKSKNFGTEIDAAAAYKINPNMELAVNAGYLFAGDAMEAFEASTVKNGKADRNIFRSTARARYTF